MTKNRENVRIYGDDASGVWVADKGEDLPEDLKSPDDEFEEVGWISEDGVDLERDEDSEDFKAWQGGELLRKKITSVDDTFKFQALEENLVTTGLYYKGRKWETSGSGDDKVAKLTVKDQTLSDERAWVVDFIDSDVTKRLVVPSGEVTERDTISHQNAEMTMYELTVTIYGDYDILTNAPEIVGDADDGDSGES